MARCNPRKGQLSAEMLILLAVIASFLLWYVKPQNKEREVIPIEDKKGKSLFNIWLDKNIRHLVMRGYVREVNKTILHERKRLLHEAEEIINDIRKQDEGIEILVPVRR